MKDGACGIRRLYRTCSELLDESALPALAEARQRFLDRLK